MKNLKIILLLSVISFSNLSAEDGASLDSSSKAITCGAEIDYNSKYLWHGQAYSDGPVLQPSVWTSYMDFTLTAWTNYEIQENLNETDVILGYSRDIGKFSIEPSLSYYNYFHQTDTAPLLEFSAKITHPLCGKFSVYTLQNFYFLSGDFGDSYFGGLGINFESGTDSVKFNISPFASLGSKKYNRENFGHGRWAINMLSLDAAVECSLPGGWYVKPHYTFTTISNKALLEDNRNNSSAGIAIGREF